jgi:predicted nucleic acid-binding protein
MKVFIDANIPMYIAGHDHPNRDRAIRFMRQVEAGDIDACTSTEVLQEILWRYSRMKNFDLAGQIYELFLRQVQSVFPVTVADTDRALALLVARQTISPRDAIHAAVMLNNGITQIATFDEGFDEIEGIERVPLT